MILSSSRIPASQKSVCYYGTWQELWWGWNCEDLLKQVRDRAIPIFEAQYRTSKALFASDNATSHTAFATDALVGKRMILGSGEKQPKMRIDRMEDGTFQPMCFPDNHPDVTLGGDRAIELKDIRLNHLF